MSPSKLITSLNTERSRLMKLGYSQEEAARKAVLKYNQQG